MKAQKLGVARPVRLFWPVIKRTRANMARPGRLAKQNGQTRCADVSTFALTVGHGLNANRAECRRPKCQHVAAMQHGRHTSWSANHQSAVWYGCQSSRSAFRQFGIPTPVKHRRYELLYIDRPFNRT